MSEINKNAEKKNTGLTEELNQLKKNRKKTAETLKSDEDKVIIFLLRYLSSASILRILVCS